MVLPTSVPSTFGIGIEIILYEHKQNSSCFSPRQRNIVVDDRELEYMFVPETKEPFMSLQRSQVTCQSSGNHRSWARCQKEEPNEQQKHIHGQHNSIPPGLPFVGNSWRLLVASEKGSFGDPWPEKCEGAAGLSVSGGWDTQKRNTRVINDFQRRNKSQSGTTTRSKRHVLVHVRRSTARGSARRTAHVAMRVRIARAKNTVHHHRTAIMSERYTMQSLRKTVWKHLRVRAQQASQDITQTTLLF